MTHAALYQATTAEEYPGFPAILWTIARRILGATRRPQYDIHLERSTDAEPEYWASVRVYSSDDTPPELYLFIGKPMPTLEMAIQVAAQDAISCLCHPDSSVQSRAFRFYPSRATPISNIQFTTPDPEDDEAVIHLTRYVAAQHNLLVQALRFWDQTRMDSARPHSLPPASSSSKTTEYSANIQEQPLPEEPVVEERNLRRHRRDAAIPNQPNEDRNVEVRRGWTSHLRNISYVCLIVLVFAPIVLSIVPIGARPWFYQSPFGAYVRLALSVFVIGLYFVQACWPQ